MRTRGLGPSCVGLNLLLGQQGGAGVWALCMHQNYIHWDIERLRAGPRFPCACLSLKQNSRANWRTSLHAGGALTFTIVQVSPL